MSSAEVLEQLAELKEAARVVKLEARKAKILGQVANVKSAGNKRSVSKLMEIMFVCNDIDELWEKLVKKAEKDGAKVVTANNINKVNDIIEAQAAKLIELRDMVTKELGMYAVAAVSPLGWQLVTAMEKNPDLDKEIHGWDIEEVRTNEKKLIQYSRDIATATKGENLILVYVKIQYFLGRQGWRWSRRQEVPWPQGGG